jgi:Metallopeptidase toxin 3
MFWLEEDEKKFPRCTTYMKHSLAPQVLKEKRRSIYNAFVKACGSEKHARKALTWGEHPRVGVVNGLIQLRGGRQCGINPPGFFNQNGKVVQISDVRVRPLEHCVAAVDLANNKRRFESTLLHEIVHFVRMEAGLTDEDFSFPDTPEVGEQFEIWAYGTRQCTVDEIADAESSIF